MANSFSDNIVISVESLGKFYPTNTAISPESAGLHRVMALDDITFSVERGSTVGIIGSNGSGKSTLLRILSGVTKPSTGRVVIKGKTAGILDIGSGFYPELSGRENIYLYGKLHGFSQAEIHRHFDEILAFSEIEKFIEEPVKSYSNGMYLRLAFSIMVHLNFELYLLDEVLSVGDSAFRLKIKNKLDELKQDGKTLLYVTHNMGEILQDFSQAIILDKGKMQFQGDRMEAVQRYMQHQVHDKLKQQENLKTHTLFNDQLVLNKISVLPRHAVDFHESARLAFHFTKPKSGKLAYFMGMIVYDTMMQPVFTTIASAETAHQLEFDQPGSYQVSCELPPSLLSPGIFTVELYFCQDAAMKQPEQIKKAIQFKIVETADSIHQFSLGSVRPNCQWSYLFQPEKKLACTSL